MDVHRLPRDPGSARGARRLVRAHLADHVPEEPLEDAVLLASELVTNALLHTRSGVLSLAVDHGPGRVSVGVGDDSPDLPTTTPAVGLVTFGRGLPLLQDLADEWWVEQHPGDGKTVWFRVLW